MASAVYFGMPRRSSVGGVTPLPGRYGPPPKLRSSPSPRPDPRPGPSPSRSAGTGEVLCRLVAGTVRASAPGCSARRGGFGFRLPPPPPPPAGPGSASHAMLGSGNGAREITPGAWRPARARTISRMTTPACSAADAAKPRWTGRLVVTRSGLVQLKTATASVWPCPAVAEASCLTLERFQPLA